MPLGDPENAKQDQKKKHIMVECFLQACSRS